MRLISALLIFLAVAAAAAAEQAAPSRDLIIKTLPGIVVDTKAREVRLEGTVCLQKGALELMVCSPGTREHESIVVVKAKPSHVTFALVLLGLAPGKPGFMTEGGAFSPPAGEVLDITARFRVVRGEGAAKKEEAVEVPAWKLLRLAGTEFALERPIEWVYVGRPGEAALKAADNEGTVICLSNFAEAVIDVPFESTSDNANLAYEANPTVVPPVGTPIELVLRPAGRRIEQKKVEIEIVVRKDKPLTLDGKPMEPAALKDACLAMPADVQTAILRADADEKFGRVMEISAILRDALMNVHLAVLKNAGPGAGNPAGPPLAISVTADDKVRLGGRTMTVDEFKAKAAELLKGTERAVLTADAKASAKTVAEVMAAARGHNVSVTLSRGGAAREEPAKK